MGTLPAALLTFGSLFLYCSTDAGRGPRLARLGDVPYSVAVGSQGGVLCSGALLDRQWVLTAAHCVYHAVFGESANQSTIMVVAGSLNNSRPRLGGGGPEQSRHSDLVVPHPSYTDTWAEFDVALVRLKKKLSLSSSVGTIRLSTQSWGNSTRLCVIPGYGVLQKGTQSPMDHRLKTHVMNVTRPCPCEHQLEKEKGSSRVHSWLCSELEAHTGPCKGDSGAPLVCNGLVWGLTSSTFYIYDPPTCNMSRDPDLSLCGNVHVLNIFMDIHPYSDWLRGVMRPTSGSVYPVTSTLWTLVCVDYIVTFCF